MKRSAPSADLQAGGVLITVRFVTKRGNCAAHAYPSSGQLESERLMRLSLSATVQFV